MGPSSLFALPLLFALGTTPTPEQSAKPGPPLPGGYLSEEDAVYLDYLVHEFLFDPKHAVRVRLTTPKRQPRISYSSYLVRFSPSGSERDGWLASGKDGQPRVYFEDGESVLASSGKLKRVDFEAQASASIHESGDNADDRLLRSLRAYDGEGDSYLVFAAWLHRRGFDGLAAKALASAREGADEDLVHAMRVRFARRAQDELTEAMCVRDDASALAHVERLFRLYPDLVETPLDIVKPIRVDLDRRRAAGTFGKTPEKNWPKGFSTWKASKRAAYLVSALDEIMYQERPQSKVNEDEFSFDPSWSLLKDPRCLALIDLGDAAVPALLDAVENDNRLTRSSEWQIGGFGCGSLDGIRPKAPIAVHEVALQLINSILKVRWFDPLHEQRPRNESRANTVSSLRTYWAAYGHLSFDGRMMAVITNSKAIQAARIDAAQLLVGHRDAQPSAWSREGDTSTSTRHDRAELIKKYRSPTAAEAILAAMDAERSVSSERDANAGLIDNEAQYVSCLADLGDEGVGAELARRAAKATEIKRRLCYVTAAHKLGYSGPMIALARDVQTGSVALAPVEADANYIRIYTCRAFRALVAALLDSHLPEADRAIASLAFPENPLFPLASYCVLGDSRRDFDSSVWEGNSVVVAIIARSLSDLRKTGVDYYLRGDEVESTTQSRQRPNKARYELGEGVPSVEHAEERVADVAASLLESSVCGMPRSHPLRRDQDEALARDKHFIERFGYGLRRPNLAESRRLGVYWSMFVPDIKPLNRPATADDVRLGRAVFELKGTGKVADAKLPAWLVLKSEAKKEYPAYGLIVQAEKDAAGKLVYGVIFRHEIRAVRAEEVERTEEFGKK